MSPTYLILATFLACAVEAVEALTIVLAVGTTRGWRWTLYGVGAATAVLAGLTAILGPALTSIPIESLQIVIGVLLILFGLQWLHKAMLRAAGLKMGSVTVHTTIADYQLRPRYRYHPTVVNYTAETPRVQAVPMGQGAIDYRQFLAALREGGFAGSIAYEMCSPLLTGGRPESLDQCARQFLDYMKTL